MLPALMWRDRNVRGRARRSRLAEGPVCFAMFTPDLYALADWIMTCRIRTVAMESAGVYWIPLFQILERAWIRSLFGQCPSRAERSWPPNGCLGFPVAAVSPCPGLLRPSFRPPQDVCALRSPLRHRDNFIKQASVHILHMQKVLDQMNLHFHYGIDGIT